LFSALALSSLSLAAGLGVGTKAPAFKVAAVVKGKPVNLAKGVHVVEFWATWCGPCKVSIPHLTEMAHKYKGKVDFTGVSVWENGEDQLGQVKKFVASMGPKMDYNVAFDGAEKSMATNWMQAAKQNGIPAAFLVKDGQVLWIGHPMGGLDKAIDQVLAGKFDVAAAKAEFDKAAAEQAESERKQAEMMKVLTPAMTAFRAKKYDEAVAELDKIQSNDPTIKMQVTAMRFNALMQLNSPRLLDEANAIVGSDLGKNAMLLNSFAWSIIDPASKIANPNYAAALILAEAAAKASDMKDGMILDTYGLALFKAGKTSDAVDIQTKAVALAKTDKNVDAATLKEMQGRLDEFTKAKG